MSRTSDKWAGFVYETTNNINGKRYVGLSTKSTTDGYLGSGTLIKAAIEKYGRENFSREILCFCRTREMLGKREIEFIRRRKPEYNIAGGGMGGNTIQYMSEEEIRAWKQKKSIAATGERNAMKRPEVVEKNRQSQIAGGKHKGQKNSQSKTNVKKREKLSKS